jgi:hypothetical protein
MLMGPVDIPSALSAARIPGKGHLSENRALRRRAWIDAAGTEGWQGPQRKSGIRAAIRSGFVVCSGNPAVRRPWIAAGKAPADWPRRTAILYPSQMLTLSGRGVRAEPGKPPQNGPRRPPATRRVVTGAAIQRASVRQSRPDQRPCRRPPTPLPGPDLLAGPRRPWRVAPDRWSRPGSEPASRPAGTSSV